MSELLVRTFTDRDGVAWTVRQVMPERVERRLADRRRSGASPTDMGPAGTSRERRMGAERRTTFQRRVRLPAQWAHGWLMLQSESGDRRRVAPVPPGWTQLSEIALALLVRISAAEPAPEE